VNTSLIIFQYEDDTANLLESGNWKTKLRLRASEKDKQRRKEERKAKEDEKRKQKEVNLLGPVYISDLLIHLCLHYEVNSFHFVTCFILHFNLQCNRHKKCTRNNWC